MPVAAENSFPTKLDNSQIQAWFEQLVSNLELDKFLLQQEIASEETKRMYAALISGDELEVSAYGRVASSKVFIKALLSEYFKSLSESGSKPSKLALELSDSKILVWAEIDDDDEVAERALLISEAKANGKFHDFGFHISTTIIEKSDKLPIPSHYQTIIA